MKKSIFKLFLCVLALVTVITAFAVVASAASVTETKGTCTVTYTDETKTAVKSVTGGKIYQLVPSAAKASSAGNLWAWNYHDFGATDSTVYTTKKDSDALKSLYGGDTRTEYGLRYDLSEDGTLTIYAASEADETTAKNYTNAWKNWGFPNGLMEYLQRTDSTYEGGWFKRNQVKKIVIEAKITAVTEQSLNAFSACSEVVLPTTLTRFDGFSLARMSKLQSIKVADADYSGYNASYVVDLRNITQQNASTFTESFNCSSIYPLQVLLGEKSSGTSNINNASWCKKDSGTGSFTVFTPDGNSCKWITDIESRNTGYDITVYRLGDTSAVTHLGYQVRTSKYNGLRAAFKLGVPEGHVVMRTGKMLETPELVSGSGASEIVEYGVIVATEANADTYGLELTKNGDVWETANAKIKKIAAEEDKVDANGNFFVTVTNFSGEAQMNAKICYVGYEIHSDGSVVYASRLAPASIGDVTIGSYAAGLINKSVEQDNVFAEVLEACKSELTLNTANIEALPTSYTYTLKDGDLVDENGVHVSIYLMGNGEYMGLVHTGEDTIKTEFKGGSYSAGAPTWKVYNFLDTMYIGVTLDTIVIDSDVTSLSGALMRSGTFMKKLIYPDGFAFGGQFLNGCKMLNTAMPFSKCDTNTDWDALVGTLDMSKCTFSQPDWIFAQAGIGNATANDKVKTIIMPLQNMDKTLGAGFFGELYNVESVYPDGGEALGNKTFDLRGTGYKLSLTDDGDGNFSTLTEIFKNIWKDIKVIQTEGDVTYMYTCTAAANNSAKPWVFTRTVYGE